MNTKKRIIEAALTLFAQKGYTDVYVGDIAEAVGIKAPSLYKHFKSKKDIFEALIEEMSENYLKQTAVIGINSSDIDADFEIYKNIAEDELIDAGKKLFLYFLHDEYMSKFRKILTLEQFKNPELASLYTKYFFEDPVMYQAGLFKLLISAGKFIEADARLMALEFYSPIYTLLTVCDRNPHMELTALQLIEEHIRRFNINYRRENKS